jgi:hypothetical protein
MVPDREPTLKLKQKITNVFLGLPLRCFSED